MISNSIYQIHKYWTISFYKVNQWHPSLPKVIHSFRGPKTGGTNWPQKGEIPALGPNFGNLPWFLRIPVYTHRARWKSSGRWRWHNPHYSKTFLYPGNAFSNVFWGWGSKIFACGAGKRASKYVKRSSFMEKKLGGHFWLFFNFLGGFLLLSGWIKPAPRLENSGTSPSALPAHRARLSGLYLPSILLEILSKVWKSENIHFGGFLKFWNFGEDFIQNGGQRVSG